MVRAPFVTWAGCRSLRSWHVCVFTYIKVSVLSPTIKVLIYGSSKGHLMQWHFIFEYEKELLVKVEKIINVWGKMLIDKGPNICASG